MSYVSFIIFKFLDISNYYACSHSHWYSIMVLIFFEVSAKAVISLTDLMQSNSTWKCCLVHGIKTVSSTQHYSAYTNSTLLNGLWSRIFLIKIVEHFFLCPCSKNRTWSWIKGEGSYLKKKYNDVFFQRQKSRDK